MQLNDIGISGELVHAIDILGNDDNVVMVFFGDLQSFHVLHEECR